VTEWISVEEAAALSGYNEQYLWQLCRKERVKCRKAAVREWLIDKDDLLSYKERMEKRPGGGPRKKDN